MDERIGALTTQLEKNPAREHIHLLDEAEDHVLPTPRPTVGIIKQLACRSYSMEKNTE